ncbi:MAG: 23S rRNA (adenine(2503)-C(2))-methyltransferase RlmN [Ruminococcaceae bacterium]|nr:23S rRNA (adenine(2503)-C(2))-methyltransferase RlmN [Oscillospiraceae bacterium]
MKTNLKDLTYDELASLIESLGEKKFRTKQIFSWLHKGVTSFDEMTDISKDLKQRLSEKSFVSTLKIERKLVSKIDKTTKYLFKLEDGNMVESVVMYYKHGISICISSQVGCRMGCKFCASTIGGLVRNLTPGEILDQVIFAQKDIGERISNIVMMGIGEPLDNYDNVIKFLKNVNDENGINIGYRHISLSTCGVVKNIYKLMELDIPITLSISLHAPSNEIRDKIMPVNKAYDINELLSACKKYIEKTNRRISFEYSIIMGVNDSENHAKMLSTLLKGMLCHVNIIPVNKVTETGFEKPDRKKIEKFVNVLLNNRINATVRRELGSDINASCGQLRRSVKRGE